MTAIAELHYTKEFEYGTFKAREDVLVDGRCTEQTFKEHVAYDYPDIKWQFAIVKLRGIIRRIKNEES